MTSNRKLELLTKSIRMLNQAKIIKLEVNQINEMIDRLRKTALRRNFQADLLQTEAHKIQLEVIPVTIIPTKKERKPRITRHKQEKIDATTLEKVFGKTEAARLKIIAEKAGLLVPGAS